MRQEYDTICNNAKKLELPNGSNVWLLTWNPQKWTWEKYKDWCAGTKAGKTYIEPWTCINRRPQNGEEVFLTRTGEKPRGIFAHGYVVKESHEAPHYDAKQAAEGKKQRRIDVKFDRIQDCATEQILPVDELNAKFPEQEWSPQNSGIAIKVGVVPTLRALWKALTDAPGK